MTTDVTRRIEAFNHDRLPEFLALKYEAMQDNAFTFLRGTCHLFYQDWDQNSSLNQAPAVWLCGDLHLENFGSYRGGDDRLYFSINDFDEAALAPCTWDVTRMLTSILVAAPRFNISDIEARELGWCFLDAYSDALRRKKIDAVNRRTAEGLVEDLLEKIARGDSPEGISRRASFIQKRTENEGQRLRSDDPKLRPVERSQRDAIAGAIAAWAKDTEKPEFFRVLDLAYRVAGTSSLGLERYAILVEGGGTPDRRYLLELKEQLAVPSLAPYLTRQQPSWATAKRVVRVQKTLQPEPPDLLAAIHHGEKSYLLREIQPEKETLDMKRAAGKWRSLQIIIETMAKVTAWTHLSGSGWKGADTEKDLANFAKAHDWQARSLKYACHYAEQVYRDFEAFRQTIGTETPQSPNPPQSN